MKRKQNKPTVTLNEYNHYEIEMTIKELENMLFVYDEPAIYVLNEGDFKEGDRIEHEEHYLDTNDIDMAAYEIYIPSIEVFDLLSREETREKGLERVRALVKYIALEHEDEMIRYVCEDIYYHIKDEVYFDEKSYNKGLKDYDWMPDAEGIKIPIPFSINDWFEDLNTVANILKKDFIFEKKEYKITGFELEDCTIILQTNLPVESAIKVNADSDDPKPQEILSEFCIRTNIATYKTHTPNPEKMLEHSFGIDNEPNGKSKDMYLKHYVKIKVPNKPYYDVWNGGWLKDKRDYILVTWYWNKNIPFNFKSYAHKNNVIESEIIYSDWGEFKTGAVYGCVEDFSGQLYERWECWN